MLPSAGGQTDKVSVGPVSVVVQYKLPSVHGQVIEGDGLSGWSLVLARIIFNLSKTNSNTVDFSKEKDI